MTEQIANPDGAPGPFRVDTELVPEGVDLDLARERTRIIESFRAGELDGEEALADLLALYWRTQRLTNGATNVYLMRMSYEFPVEAGIDATTATEIWREAQEMLA